MPLAHVHPKALCPMRNSTYSIGHSFVLLGVLLIHLCFSLRRNLAYLSPPKQPALSLPAPAPPVGLGAPPCGPGSKGTQRASVSLALRSFPNRRADNPDAPPQTRPRRYNQSKDTRLPYHPEAQRSGRPKQVHSNNASRWAPNRNYANKKHRLF